MRTLTTNKDDEAFFACDICGRALTDDKYSDSFFCEIEFKDPFPNGGIIKHLDICHGCMSKIMYFTADLKENSVNL